MIAPIEDATAAGSGKTAPTTPTAPDAPATPTPSTAPADPTTAPSKPRWAPAMTNSGTAISPASYARTYGDTPEGLVQWAELNQTHLGIPGEYNAAVLFQAAGRLTERGLALGMIAAQLKALRAVFNGESLKNEQVRDSFRQALDVIEEETAGFAPLTAEEIEAAKIEAPEPVPGWDKIDTTTDTTTATETTNSLN